MADSSKYGQLWSREELILAFELYCRIPFARTKASNPEVRRLANAIDRTPASVARKLGNFGAFDPELQKRNISGLGHGSKLDEQVWVEFNSDWESLVLLSQRIRSKLAISKELDSTWAPPKGPSERLRTAKQRLHQSFFREAVLSSYVGRCAVTGIAIAECLIASHIVPWSELTKARSNPKNGICLSATMDRLFDCGLLTFRSDFTIEFSRRIMSIKDKPIVEQVASYHGKPMLLPERFLPDVEFLTWHQKNRFQKS